MTKEEAYETMFNNMFSAMFNGNDFFAYACAWAVEVNDYDDYLNLMIGQQ